MDTCNPTTVFNSICNLYGKGSKTPFFFSQIFESATYIGVEVEVDKAPYGNPIFAMHQKNDEAYFTVFHPSPQKQYYEDKLREYFEIKCSSEGIRYSIGSFVYAKLEDNTIAHITVWEVKTIFYVLRDWLLA